MKANIEIDVAVYPDGDILIFSDSDTLAEFKRDQVIRSIRTNTKSCDWLSPKDLREFIDSLERLYKELKS